MKKTILTILIFAAALFCAAQNDSITNISVVQRTDGSGLVDINFNLYGPGSSYDITIEVSFDAGNVYTPIPSVFLSGDITNISPGENRQIVWDGLGSFPGTYSTQSMLKIIANGEVSCPSTLTDIDENVYTTVLIGDQCWMAANLKTTKYSNGSPIEYPGPDYWAWYNNTTGAYAWNDNDISWKNIYGALYNLYAVKNANGLCPTGWHVPTDAEYTTLSNYLGGESVAGGKMKSIRTDPDPHPRWNSPNAGATNESYWTGFPGGIRDYWGFFGELGTRGAWWTSTEVGSNGAWSRSIYYSGPSIIPNSDFFPQYGLNVRCLKDE